MPRVQTNAAERTAQNARLKKRAEQALGRTVSIREAEAWAREQSGKPLRKHTGGKLAPAV